MGKSLSLTMGGAEQESTHSQVFIKLLSETSTVLGTADTLVIKTSSFSWCFVGTQTMKTGAVTLLFLKLLEANTQFHIVC